MRRGAAIGAGVAAVLGALVFARSSEAASGLVPYSGDPRIGAIDARGRTHRTPRGPRMVARQLPPWPGTTRAWVRFVVQLFESFGLSRTASILLAAHVARETNFGRRSWNNNFGNLKQYDEWGPWAVRHAWHRLSDHEPYMSFNTAGDGARAMIFAIRPRGGGAVWAKLLAGDPTWYGDLGRTRYYGDAPANDPQAVEAAAVRGQTEYSTNFLPIVQRAAA